MFITLEGIEGSGKSTLALALAGALRSAGKAVISVREPGGTPVGDAVRGIFLQPGLPIDPVGELFLINASRQALVWHVIRPALDAGKLVICDRYVDSTRAYQGFGRGLKMADIDAACELATGGLQPSLTLLLDIDLAVSEERLRSRGNTHDRMEQEDVEFYARVRNGFLQLAERSAQFRRLDATQPVEALVERALLLIAESR
ncbi:MAG: dTMP kinase [Vulcanimicrobiaceae bacterium]